MALLYRCYLLSVATIGLSYAVTLEEGMANPTKYIMYDTSDFKWWMHALIALFQSYVILAVVWAGVFLAWKLTGKKHIKSVVIQDEPADSFPYGRNTDDVVPSSGGFRDPYQSEALPQEQYYQEQPSEHYRSGYDDDYDGQTGYQYYPTGGDPYAAGYDGSYIQQDTKPAY